MDLSHCHQTQIIAQIVAGVILGPLFLGRHDACFEMIFPSASRLTLTTFAEFGMVIHFFKMGVQINPIQILKIEKKAMVIGLGGHLSAIAIGTAVLNIVDKMYPLGSEKEGIYGLVVCSALTAFPVTSGFLNEMNILNSEIGRVALSTSIISDACMWVNYFVIVNTTKALQQGSCRPILELTLSLCYISILFFLLRPLVIWISNRNPKGKPITESHFVSIISILLFIASSAQVCGQPAFLVAFWFGLILPDGPPLGSVLAEKLDTVGSTLIVPAFCTIIGTRTNVPPLTGSKTASLEIILIAGYMGKFLGILLPSLHFQIDFWDSLALALIMCCKGLVDISVFNILFNSKDIGEVSFSLTIYTMVAVTGFASLVVYYIYDPSRRYRAYIRRSIRHSDQDLDLKVLVCVHNEENVYPIINLLQASNPIKATPLSVFVLHLMELSGRAFSILTKNEDTNKSHSYKESSSQHISNAFDQFQLHNKEGVKLQFFTVIAPYASMHDDICYMAMDTKSDMVIVPFHKQWSIHGNFEVPIASVRTLNQKVLRKAPCSVGVFIDRSEMSGKLLVIYEKLYCDIAMIFVGGGDDQEALAYSLRIAQHPNVRLTVFWLRVKMQGKQRNTKNPYIDLMEHIRYSNKHNNQQVTFKEESVEDGAGTTQVIRKMEGNFSMVIVGRHHMPDSPCTLGLTEWCELPELGPIGNLLATSDFTFSVLVVQQQSFYNFRCMR
ncbi:cation/H(+) antiporter 14-like [Gastrolobium bilobum]|uniref:cation/H(+) antiporter 14-like n=1 Tax=Gastrolobium bilobum TaxID=150636 RepID=UPI002AB2EFFC|nr:cation/H(+) antiporter 14-like [Gastrolobium bilobum]